MTKQTFKVKPRKPGKTRRHRLKMYGITVTKQSFKDDCDINLIMARFIKTGVIDHVRTHGGEYGFATSTDYTESMQLIRQAESMFEDLPSQIRTKFENDPAQFLDFVQDDKNIDEMREMGLANPLTETAKTIHATSNEPSGTAKSGDESGAMQEQAPETVKKD